MGLFNDMMKQAVGDMMQSQAEIPHSHIGHIHVKCTDADLICGSKFFLDFNDGEFVAGFSRAELIEFQNGINDGITKALAMTGTPVSPTDQTCLLCNQAVDADTGFTTSVGWMHFECKKDQP